ncbi:MAG TPA: GNAT family N-acetyltransferase [Acidobacteriaceae bacterium]
MEPAITIRIAESPADLAAMGGIFRTYAHFLQHHLGFQHICMPTYEQEIAALPGRYAPPDGILLLALVDDAPAGCIALQRVPDHHLLPGDATVGELKRLFVLPEFRGHQLGSRLIDTALAFARQRNYDAIYLDTVPSRMPRPAALYTALGFQPAPCYNGNTDEGVRHFRLDLHLPN